MATQEESAEGMDQLSAHLNENVRSIGEFHDREEQKLGAAQRLLERISAHLARPGYLFGILLAVALWVGGNAWVLATHRAAFDPPPFARLQGIMSLAALLTASVVLGAQTRQMALEKQRAQIDLQINLMTEQKVTKLIALIEELRRDLPMVPDRHDSVASHMQRGTSTGEVLSALEDMESGRANAEPAEPRR
jgi:uncharacterized membrane protein